MPFAVLDTVETPYGPGYIKAVRSDEKDYVVLLRNWQLAQGQSPTCYLAEDQMKPRTEEMVNAYIGPNPPEAKVQSFERAQRWILDLSTRLLAIGRLLS